MCRATAEELLKEYKACESPDYISYVRFSSFIVSILLSMVLTAFVHRALRTEITLHEGRG